MLEANYQVSCRKHRFFSNFEMYEGMLNLSASTGCFTSTVSIDLGTRTTLINTGDIAYFSEKLREYLPGYHSQ
jgi:hypothetical protein